VSIAAIAELNSFTSTRRAGSVAQTANGNPSHRSRQSPRSRAARAAVNAASAGVSGRRSPAAHWRTVRGDTAPRRATADRPAIPIAGRTAQFHRSVSPSSLARSPPVDAADLCAAEPARAARNIVDRGFTNRYDYALKTLQEVRYDQWREYDPEDTIRYYALRLHEAGMIKSSPQKIIAENADWRFFNELKRELRA